MATPDELDSLSDNLRGAYELAWTDIRAEQDAIAADPAKFTRRARLAELEAAVNERLDHVDAAARSWLADEFPLAYRMGAEAAGGMLDQPFRWTTIDNEAVTLLAQDTFGELLAATDGVSDSTKALIRELGRRQALLKAAAGKTATQAARELRRLLEQRGIFAVRYKDGSRHGLADYTDMLLRTKTGVAHNAGGLNFARRAGTRYVEVFDGADCGWLTHLDNDKANRSIRTVEEAAKVTLSHPRCRRSFGPRPDIQTPEQAANAKSSITDAQAADQAAAERARALSQRDRRAARRRQESARTRRAAERQARAAAR
ncbi:MAG: phage minor capsid protein [Chloroflexi bacterium]|nr:phage minor capsid protein [Chloroflexota bacterium]